MYSAHTVATSYTPQSSAISDDSESSSLAAAFPRRSKCYFCGGSYYNMRLCPARDACCNNCNNKRHCHMKTHVQAQQLLSVRIHSFPTYNCTTGFTAALPQSLSHAAVTLSINGHSLTVLTDSCSSDSFMSETMYIVKILELEIKPSTRKISMALSTMNTKISLRVLWDRSQAQWTWL